MEKSEGLGDVRQETWSVVAGIARRLTAAIPLPVLQVIMQTAMNRLLRHHPDLLDRLSRGPSAVLGLDVADLPFAMTVAVGGHPPRLTVSRTLAGRWTDAVVAGRLAAFFALCEGRVDGDALFFSRELTFQGDTALVVRMRNNLEGAAIDILADLAADLGPFGTVFSKAMTHLRQCASSWSEQADVRGRRTQR